MARTAVTFLIGLLFGLGLVVAGMSNPQKVLNFLDVAAIPRGLWDPSLAFVMLGAVAVAFVGFRIVLARATPWGGGSFRLPPTTGLEARLLVGPALFGIGWGLVGFCPGPAVVGLGFASPDAVAFVAAMVAGMIAARYAARRFSVLTQTGGSESPAVAD